VCATVSPFRRDVSEFWTRLTPYPTQAGRVLSPRVGCPALLLIPTLVFHGLHTVSTFRPPVRVTAGVGLRECGGTARIVDFSSAGALTCTHNFFTLHAYDIRHGTPRCTLGICHVTNVMTSRYVGFGETNCQR